MKISFVAVFSSLLLGSALAEDPVHHDEPRGSNKAVSHGLRGLQWWMNGGGGGGGGRGRGRGRMMAGQGGQGLFQARGGQGRGGGGGGRGGGGGGGGWMMMGGGNSGAQRIIHNLLDNHDAVKIQVIDQEDGVFVKSTSDDPQVASWIQNHVQSMMDLIESGGNIRRWDPLFAKLLDHRDEFEGVLELIPGGVEFTETASSECAIDLVQWHADVVELFVKNGRPEAQKAHAVPPSCN